MAISADALKMQRKTWQTMSLNAFLQNWMVLGLELPNSMRGISAFEAESMPASRYRHGYDHQSMLVEAIHSTGFGRPTIPHHHLDYQERVRKMAETWDEKLHAQFVEFIMDRLKEMGREPGPPLESKSSPSLGPRFDGSVAHKRGLATDHFPSDKAGDAFIKMHTTGSFSTTGTTGFAEGKTTAVEILEKMEGVRRVVETSAPIWPFAAGDRTELGKREPGKSPLDDAMNAFDEAEREVFVRSSDRRAKIPRNAEVGLSDEEAHALMVGGTW